MSVEKTELAFLVTKDQKEIFKEFIARKGWNTDVKESRVKQNVNVTLAERLGPVHEEGDRSAEREKVRTELC